MDVSSRRRTTDREVHLLFPESACQPTPSLFAVGMLLRPSRGSRTLEMRSPSKRSPSHQRPLRHRRGHAFSSLGPSAPRLDSHSCVQDEGHAPQPQGFAPMSSPLFASSSRFPLPSPRTRCSLGLSLIFPGSGPSERPQEARPSGGVHRLSPHLCGHRRIFRGFATSKITSRSHPLARHRLPPASITPRRQAFGG